MTQIEQPGGSSQEVETLGMEVQYQNAIQAISDRVIQIGDTDLITKTEVKLETARRLLAAGKLPACFEKISETVRMVHIALGEPSDNLDNAFLNPDKPESRVRRIIPEGQNPLDQIRSDLKGKVGLSRRRLTDN